MPVVVSIHAAFTCWREGLRAVREGKGGGAREGWRNQLLLIHNVIKIKCLLTLHQHYTDNHAGRIKGAIQAISKRSEHILHWTLVLITITMATSEGS